MARWLLGVLAIIGIMGLCIGGTVVADDQRWSSESSTLDKIEDNQTYYLAPEEPGEIEVVHEYTLPERVTRFKVSVPQRGTVVETSGFVREDDRTYAWDESTTDPTLTYRTAVNRTVESEGPNAGPGEYLFVDTGAWALFQRSVPDYRWGWVGDDPVRLNRTANTGGPGMVSEALGFLGPYDVHRGTAHGQEFLLVEPGVASLAEDPSEIFASLAHASDQLRVGDRDERVVMFAAPTGEVAWGVRGLQSGPADMWVRDVESLTEADNVWVHEYVHSRQDYSTSAESRWVTEATATYYAALLTAEAGRIDFADFKAHLQRGESVRFDGVELADPETWQHRPDYLLGALVVGALDRAIRLAHEGSRSFVDIFHTLNEYDGSIAHAQILEVLQAVGDDDVAAAGDEFLTTTRHPTMWNASEHAAVFSTEPPRFATETVDMRVRGEYRNRELSNDRSPTLVPGETLILSVEVTNRGQVRGEFDLPVRVDGETIDRKTGSLDPGERTRFEVSYEFGMIGAQQFSVGEASKSVDVRPPAQASVRSFSIDPDRVTVGESVTVQLHVENDASYPGETSIVVTKNGDVGAERLARLDADAEETLTVSVDLPQPGEVRIGIRDTSLEPQIVTVERMDESASPLAGAGVGAILVALLATVVVMMYRDRQKSV